MINSIALKERIFELIDDVLYVFEKGLIEAGLSVSYYRKEKSSKNKRLVFLNHPTDKRYNLVAFQTLSEDHQKKITARFGNPYDHVARIPILQQVVPVHSINDFFLKYRFDGGKMLPIKRVKQYSRACYWLELLKKVEESRNKMIKEMGISVPEFYNHLAALMETEKANGLSDTFEGANQLPAKFPTSYRNLKPKVQQYIEQGPAIMIDSMYGNNLAAKINDDVAEAQLLELIENPNQYDDVLVCMLYNVWAKNNDYKLIEPATVGVWRRKKEALIISSREGAAAFNEKYIRQVKGLLPSVPLALVEHDDNNLDFLFADEDGGVFNKYVSIVVIDSRTKLLLGKSYAVGQSPKQWQVHHAYLDAMYYIKHLTGGWHLPFELKADKWASKSLTPFYEKIGRFVPPSHGNKHRGYIEQYFASPLWKRSQKLVSELNYTGNNITARHRGVNNEMLVLNAKDRPQIGNEAELQIERFFHLLRNMPDFKRTDMNVPSKEQQFLTEWNKLSTADKRPISDEQFLLTFGIEHNPDRKITINNRGIEPQINGHRFSYDLPETWMYNSLIGAGVNIIYDPYDLSRVLVTNHDDIRFIATNAQLQPRALKDQYRGSRTYLNALLAEKKVQVNEVAEAFSSRKSKTDKKLYNYEAMLQGGVMVKELKNEAEQLYIESNGAGYTEEPFDPLDRM